MLEQLISENLPTVIRNKYDLDAEDVRKVLGGFLEAWENVYPTIYLPEASFEKLKEILLNSYLSYSDEETSPITPNEFIDFFTAFYPRLKQAYGDVQTEHEHERYVLAHESAHWLQNANLDENIRLLLGDVQQFIREYIRRRGEIVIDENLTELTGLITNVFMFQELQAKISHLSLYPNFSDSTRIIMNSQNLLFSILPNINSFFSQSFFTGLKENKLFSYDGHELSSLLIICEDIDLLKKIQSGELDLEAFQKMLKDQAFLYSEVPAHVPIKVLTPEVFQEVSARLSSSVIELTSFWSDKKEHFQKLLS